MAVDYTKVFTVIGSYADKVNDYYAYIATLTSNKSAIDTILAAQSVIYFEDGLTDLYEEFKNEVSGWTTGLIDRVSTVLTDEALIGANFSFGAEPTLPAVWPLLLHDMYTDDKNVTASVMTTGSPTYDTNNSEPGILRAGAVLDGVTSPRNGAPAISDYAGISSQLYPTSETLTFTCVSDSENGATRGSETFEITGTGPQSGPFDTLGENAGNLGSITVANAEAAQYASNAHFDSWTADEPDSWTIDAGVGGTNFEEETTDVLVTGEGSSFKTIGNAGAGTVVTISQVLSSSSFVRLKSYWIGVWAKKLTDVADDPVYALRIQHNPSGGPATITGSMAIQPSGGTSWQFFSKQIVMPVEIEGDLELILTGSVSTDTPAEDNIAIDGIVITPCEYHLGCSFLLVSGAEKWIIGDTAIITISNNNAGVFQTFFRKAYGVQLPTDATPTISDALVT